MNPRANLFSTYSIVARDPDTGQLGGAVQTHQMGVGRIVLWMAPGLGVLATQSLANIRYGPMTLTMLAEGIEPTRIIDALVASDAAAHQRQMAVVNAQGRAAAWTGDGCIREASHHVGEGYSVQANMMTNSTVIAAMTDAFENASGDLAQRMMAALQAAQSEGGDIRGMQSAALKVVSGDKTVPAWETIYDLRVDEHDDSVTELARLVRLRNAQLIDNRGYESLGNGQRDEALQLWKQARQQAPELEELAFWQTVTLADEHNDVATAATIFHSGLANDPRLAHWVDLINRVVECGLMKRDGAGLELKAALRSNPGERS